MPYAILRFQKRKAGGVAACERHNERKKEAYKSNPDIDMERSKNNYHLVAPPKYTYKKEINRKVAEAGCRTRKDSVMMVETLITACSLCIYCIWREQTEGKENIAICMEVFSCCRSFCYDRRPSVCWSVSGDLFKYRNECFYAGAKRNQHYCIFLYSNGF